MAQESSMLCIASVCRTTPAWGLAIRVFPSLLNFYGPHPTFGPKWFSGFLAFLNFLTYSILFQAESFELFESNQKCKANPYLLLIIFFKNIVIFLIHRCLTHQEQVLHANVFSV